jgi:hypothetical protein
MDLTWVMKHDLNDDTILDGTVSEVAFHRSMSKSLANYIGLKIPSLSSDPSTK